MTSIPRSVLALGLCTLLLHAHAATEPTPHGAQSSVAISYATPAPSGPPLWRNPNSSGDFFAGVPAGSVTSRFGSSSLSVDVRAASLEAAYGEPVLDNVFDLPRSEAATRWWDTWTVVGGSGAGTLHVTLRYTADFTGDTALTYLFTQAQGDAAAERFRLETGTLSGASPGDVSIGTPASNVYYGFDLPFEYGQPFQVVSSLTGFQGTACCGTGAFEAMTVDIVAVAVAPGAQLLASSGDASVYHVIEVPEPAAWVLLLVGLAAVGAWGRRRPGRQVRARQREQTMLNRPVRAALALAMCVAPLLAAAALEATPHGAQSSVEISFTTPFTGSWPIDAPSPPPEFEWAGAKATGSFAAQVPAGAVQSGYGASSLSLDGRAGTLQALYGKPVFDFDNYPVGVGSTRWWDTWTVTGGSGAGTLQVTLKYSADFKGDTFLTYALSQQTAAGSQERFRIETGINGQGTEADVAVGVPATDAVYRLEIPFEYGQSFQLVSSLSGQVLKHWDESPDGPFENMSVEFVSVQLAPGAQLSVSSGDPSVYHVSQVPEPATWALLLAGVPVLLCRGRRRVDSSAPL